MERTRVKYYKDKDGLYKSNVWFKYYRKNDDKFIDCQVIFDKETCQFEIVTRTKTCLAFGGEGITNLKVLQKHIRMSLKKLGISIIDAKKTKS